MTTRRPPGTDRLTRQLANAARDGRHRQVVKLTAQLVERTGYDQAALTAWLDTLGRPGFRHPDGDDDGAPH